MADTISSSSAPALWQATRLAPPLQAGQVQLWRLHVSSLDAPLRARRAAQSQAGIAHISHNVAEAAYARPLPSIAEDEGARLERLITEEEGTRRDRFRMVDDRRRFARARGLLRTLLAAQLSTSASSIAFVLGPSGKPALPPGPDQAPARVRFNVSHSHEWILIGLALDREVGVDVEHYQPRGELLDLARRFFSAREVAALEALPPASQDAAFYTTWACKESFVKVIGQGLSAGLEGFSVLGAAEGRHETELRWEPRDARGVAGAEPTDARRDSSGRTAAEEQGMEALGEPSDWTIRLLDIGPGYAAAVAVEGPPPRLELFEWR